MEYAVVDKSKKKKDGNSGIIVLRDNAPISLNARRAAVALVGGNGPVHHRPQRRKKRIQKPID